MKDKILTCLSVPLIALSVNTYADCTHTGKVVNLNTVTEDANNPEGGVVRFVLKDTDPNVNKRYLGTASNAIASRIFLGALHTGEVLKVTKKGVDCSDIVISSNNGEEWFNFGTDFSDNVVDDVDLLPPACHVPFHEVGYFMYATNFDISGMPQPLIDYYKVDTNGCYNYYPELSNQGEG